MVVNLTRGNLDHVEANNLCSVHKLKMHKVLVQTNFGLSAFEFDERYLNYPNPKRSTNLGCVKPMWPIHRLAIIYACNECTKTMRNDIGRSSVD
jgi:hypothetical protein